MKTFNEFLSEATTTNKFNIHWQLARTKARDIKDPHKKIEHVLNFLNTHKNIHNYHRVHNWVKMTGVAYKGEHRDAFEHTAKYLEAKKPTITSTEDDDNDLSKISTEDLHRVHKDLSKRKYGFQYKSVPKAHTEFMNQLKTELDNR